LEIVNLSQSSQSLKFARQGRGIIPEQQIEHYGEADEYATPASIAIQEASTPTLTVSFHRYF
jgi:hypothetical protein